MAAATRGTDRSGLGAGLRGQARSRRALLLGACAVVAGAATPAGPARATGSSAGTQAGAGAMPDPAQPAHAWLPDSRRIGQGTLRALGFTIYDAALFALSDFDPARYAQHPLVLEILYRRSFAGTDIADYSLKEMRRAGDIDDATAQRWVQFMHRAFPDVRAGDRLTGQWLPARATSRFAANDGPSVELADAQFGPRFFGIWLAPRTPRPDMREQLLGLRSSSTGPTR